VRSLPAFGGAGGDQGSEGRLFSDFSTFLRSNFLNFLKNRNLQPGIVNSEPVNGYYISD